MAFGAGLGGIGSIFSAILPLAFSALAGGGGGQQVAPAPTPPPPPPPAPAEEEPENAADIEAAKRRNLQRQSDREQTSLLQIQDEDPASKVKRKTLLAGD